MKKDQLTMQLYKLIQELNKLNIEHNVFGKVSHLTAVYHDDRTAFNIDVHFTNLHVLDRMPSKTLSSKAISELISELKAKGYEIEQPAVKKKTYEINVHSISERSIILYIKKNYYLMCKRTNEKYNIEKIAFTRNFYYENVFYDDFKPAFANKIKHTINNIEIEYKAVDLDTDAQVMILNLVVNKIGYTEVYNALNDTGYTLAKKDH